MINISLENPEVFGTWDTGKILTSVLSGCSLIEKSIGTYATHIKGFDLEFTTDNNHNISLKVTTHFSGKTKRKHTFSITLYMEPLTTQNMADRIFPELKERIIRNNT